MGVEERAKSQVVVNVLIADLFAGDDEQPVSSNAIAETVANVLLILSTNSLHLKASSLFTSLAALIGSVSPSPNDGQSLANAHAPHAGLRA